MRWRSESACEKLQLREMETSPMNAGRERAKGDDPPAEELQDELELRRHFTFCGLQVAGH